MPGHWPRPLKRLQLFVNSIPRVWGGAGNGETCDACDEVITRKQLLMEGIGAGKTGFQFHVRCFSVWDELRREAEVGASAEKVRC